ncbi:MAG: endonuclease/exonuclease/phosphatase family protein [Pseudomonadota bacterium]
MTGSPPSVTKRVLWVAILFCALCLAFGFLGRFHGFFDALAVGRLVLTLALAILGVAALLLRLWSAAGLAALALLAVLPSLWPYLTPPQPLDAPLVTGFQHNIRFDNRSQAEIFSEIQTRDPDFVLLQEVSGLSAGLRDALKATYPHHLHCHLNYGWAAIVMTRLPPTGVEGCNENGRLSFMQVTAPDGTPITLASIHLGWPWPYGQKTFVETTIRPTLRRAPAPVLLAGDFNQQPWSAVVHDIARISGTEPLPGRRWTFWIAKLLPLQIDNVLSDPGLEVSAQLLGRYGSDHHAQWIEIRRPSSR